MNKRGIVLTILFTTLLLSCHSADAARGRKKKAAERRLAKTKNDGLGATTPATAPMHKVVCDGRPCRPGEGNLVGYKHWSMPWEPPPITGLSKTAPHGWGNGAAFPEEHYRHLVSAASSAVGGRASKFLIFAAADFDFREFGVNWYQAIQQSTKSAGGGASEPSLLYALDAEAYDYFVAKGIPTCNGTANLNAWLGTRLQRHIQRALAERHMAAAALVHAGFDVLLTDTTHVFRKPVTPFFAEAFARGESSAADVFAMRGGCNAKKEPLGCGFMWNFMLLRGASSGTLARRQRIVTFVQAAIDVGMVDVRAASRTPARHTPLPLLTSASASPQTRLMS